MRDEQGTKAEKPFVTGTGGGFSLLSVFLLLQAPDREIGMNDATAKARLEASLVELEARLTNISRDLAEPPDPDWDEQAIAQEDDQALEHQGSLIEQEITSVRRALGRIEDGTYGICVRCGEKISPERLKARPEAALCIACARSAAYPTV